MQEWAALLGIFIALAIGAASPGPSFLMVAQTAAARGRVAGIYAALGMGTRALLFAIAALLGLNALCVAIPFLFIALKIVGGLYLAYLGWRIWAGATQSLGDGQSSLSLHKDREYKYFGIGLVTQISNPKTAIVYASVFAAFMPQHVSAQFNAVVLICSFSVDAGWYAIVATLLSTQHWRNGYLKYKKWVDRCAGTVMGVLGVKLVSSTASS